MHNAPNINFAWTMLAAEECFRLGVRHAVICPGSRSAPLALAFARHGGIRVQVAHDERGAAFVALGIAKSSGIPAVLVLTSGTAVANALPAVAAAAALPEDLPCDESVGRPSSQSSSTFIMTTTRCSATTSGAREAPPL